MNVTVIYNIDGIEYEKEDCFGQISSYERFVKRGTVRYIKGHYMFARYTSTSDVGILGGLTFKRKIYWKLCILEKLQNLTERDWNAEKEVIRKFYKELGDDS